MPCLPKRGPLPDWPVWTRERMLSGAAAGGEGSQDEREREDSPPQDKSVEALTSGSSLRAPSGLSLQAPCELNPVVKEGGQSLAREINLRETGEEGEQSLVPEISLRAVDKTLPSQAGTQRFALTTMRANSEETIVLNPPALHAPTTTLEPGLKNQARLDAIKRSRLDGTYAPPDGMVEWQRLNPSKGAREWIVWQNNQKAEAEIAKEKKLKLLPFETRPFNYARLNEDEAPHLHALSFDGNKGDDEEDCNDQFSPSLVEDNMNEDNLGDALDRLLNSSSSVSPLNGTRQSPEQEEDDMVDYSEGDNEEEFLRKERERSNTMRAKIFADEHTKVEANNNIVAEDEDELGDNNSARSGSSESTPAEQSKEKDREGEAQEGAQVVKPVLTQKGLMDIIAKQP
jgi:hypothetical protein